MCLAWIACPSHYISSHPLVEVSPPTTTYPAHLESVVVVRTADVSHRTVAVLVSSKTQPFIADVTLDTLLCAVRVIHSLRSLHSSAMLSLPQDFGERECSQGALHGGQQLLSGLGARVWHLRHAGRLERPEAVLPAGVGVSLDQSKS